MKACALLGSLLLGVIAQAQDYEARVFTAPEGGTLPYRLLKPQNYDAAQKYPLVILLHGAGERGDDNKLQLKWGSSLFTKPEIREKHAAFVLVPQCAKDKKWVEMDWGGEDGTAPADPGQTQKLLLRTIDSVAKEFSIDPDRHYLTGLSMGGYGTWDLITRYPERWAAAIPICGGGDKSKAAAAKAVPVWAFHGEVDTVVKPIRTKLMVEALKAAGGAVSSTLYSGVAHDSWSFAFAEPTFLPWMFAQRRGQPAQKMDLAVSPLTVLAMPKENVFPGTGPLQLADWFQKLWMQRRVEFARNQEKDRGAVIFLGDSITQGWGTLIADFPGMKVANRGISGDTSRGVRYRLKEDVMELQPKAVSLLIGTNDLSLGGEPEQVIENIKAIINELQKQNPAVPIVLNRVMPRGPQPGKFPEKIQKLNGLIDSLVAADKRLTLCDTWTIFADAAGSCKKEEFPDMLHPNKVGYAKWKTALGEVFAKLKLP
jgi:lysophospholipase L1-like esterase/poly(3-hydroxybutyrate) depolymerase